MQNQNRPQFGRGNSRPFGQNNNRRGNSRPRHQGEQINASRYTKASRPVTITEYTPQNAFDAMGLRADVLEGLTRMGYTVPSPIQDQAIPHIMAGKDVIGLAATGTGKTAAFLLPLMHKTLEKENKTSTLIICPTRELAQQIEEELYHLKSRAMNLFAAVVVGGASIGEQIRKLSHPNQFVIGTPGRLKDLINKNKLDLSTFETIVLDEVDRMLDMGFYDDVMFIVNQIHENRQSLFFSATMDPKQQAIIARLTKDAITIQVSTPGNSSDNVEQKAEIVRSTEDKYPKLVEILKSAEVTKAIIFTRTKRYADIVSEKLQKDMFPVAALHGDMRQSARKRTLDDFKRDRIMVLVATDVAARGIDVKDISHVINYDEPATYDEYIHRIGRTGRAGKTGISITFVEKR